MYISYLLYQAERDMTAREQRAADIRAGQLAAEFSRLRRALRHPLRRGTEAHGAHTHTAVACNALAGSDAAFEELERAGLLDAGGQARHLTSLCN